MRRPASMGNAGMTVEDLVHVRLNLLDELIELRDLADFFESEDFILLVSFNGESCGVIASIFQA